MFNDGILYTPQPSLINWTKRIVIPICYISKLRLRIPCLVSHSKLKIDFRFPDSWDCGMNPIHQHLSEVCETSKICLNQIYLESKSLGKNSLCCCRKTSQRPKGTSAFWVFKWSNIFLFQIFMIIKPSSLRVSYWTQDTLRERLPIIRQTFHRISDTCPPWCPFKKKSRQRAVASTSIECWVWDPFSVLLGSRRVSAVGSSSSLPPPSFSYTLQTNNSCPFSNLNSTLGESFRSYPVCEMQASLYKDKGGPFPQHRLPVFWNTFCGPFNPFPEYEKNSTWQLRAVTVHTAP